MINLLINDQKVSVQEGTTVLAAAKKLKINIPTLCNHDDLVLQATAGYVLLNKKEQGLLLHHVQLLHLKEWRSIQIL